MLRVREIGEPFICIETSSTQPPLRPLTPSSLPPSGVPPAPPTWPPGVLRSSPANIRTTRFDHSGDRRLFGLTRFGPGVAWRDLFATAAGHRASARLVVVAPQGSDQACAISDCPLGMRRAADAVPQSLPSDTAVRFSGRQYSRPGLASGTEPDNTLKNPDASHPRLHSLDPYTQAVCGEGLCPRSSARPQHPSQPPDSAHRYAKALRDVRSRQFRF